MQARAQREKARTELDDSSRQVELQVRTAYSTFIEAREVLDSQLKVQEQADEALRLARARSDAGTGTQLDVLNAETLLTQARTTQARQHQAHGLVSDPAQARAGRPKSVGAGTDRRGAAQAEEVDPAATRRPSDPAASRPIARRFARMGHADHEKPRTNPEFAQKACQSDKALFIICATSPTPEPP